MTQVPGALPIPMVLDYERTLILAIELSNTSWVLAAQIPGLLRVKAKRSVEPTPEALIAAIEEYRARAVKAGRNFERVVAVYEAGWSGFWLARWLARYGIETHVIQPSSVPVDRRARELCGILGDGVNQAADFFSDATSIPSWNVTPLTTFGN